MRVRILAILSTTALFVLAAVPASASRDAHGYLALGDSVAFGYSPLIFGNADLFVGYPNTVAATLDLPLVNASCPGETTAGFVLRTPPTDYMCLPYLNFSPLSTPYSGAPVPFALHYLTPHPTL